MRTEAQKQASRANGARSRGPVSDEGKAAVRFNGLKHGLRAEEVVIPGEDPAEFEAERAAWFEDWKPRSQARAALVERAFLANWKLRRAARNEAARLARAADDAAYFFESERVARIDRAQCRFNDDPGTAISLLSLSAGGLDRMIDRWSGLARALEAGAAGWSDPDFHHARLMILLGRRPDDSPATVGPAAVASARLLASNAPGASPRPEADADADVALVRARIEAELALLREQRALKPEPEAERARAVLAATAETSEESKLRHRYEVAHERTLRESIRQLLALERAGADLGSEEVEAVVQEQDTPQDPMPEPPAPGSVGTPPRAPLPTPAPAPVPPPNRPRGGRNRPPARAGGGRKPR